MTRWLLPGAVLLALTQACGASQERTASSADSRRDEVRRIQAHTCARCHAPPEASRHTRAELEVILGRHRVRAKLTAEQWDEMVDLLARSDETPGPR